MIWRNDAEGRFTFMAEGAEQLFGWTADDLVGRHFARHRRRGVAGRRERGLEAA